MGSVRFYRGCMNIDIEIFIYFPEIDLGFIQRLCLQPVEDKGSPSSFFDALKKTGECLGVAHFTSAHLLPITFKSQSPHYEKRMEIAIFGV